MSDEQQRFSRHTLFYERDILESFSLPRLVVGGDITGAVPFSRKFDQEHRPVTRGYDLRRS
jgi:hypothetical protein